MLIIYGFQSTSNLINKCSGDGNDEAWSKLTDIQPGEVLLDMFDTADFQWLDNCTLEADHL